VSESLCCEEVVEVTTDLQVAFSEEGAHLEEDATLTYRGHCQEMSGKPRLDDAELQKDFQLAANIFSLSTRALICFAIAAAALCDTERYTKAFIVVWHAAAALGLQCNSLL
jgi:hypothetical protein